MALSAYDRGLLISRWSEPSSDSEVARQERAERMVRNAIERAPAFAGTSYSIFAKGSYANNTNVRIDSDVDIVVQCDDCQYFDYANGLPQAPTTSPYTGKWTPQVWRSEVESALVSYFGTDVNTSGNVAIRIPERPGSRPSTDVVPSFDYALYWTVDRSRSSRGSVVYPTKGGRIVNWPQQQLDNGRRRNVDTGQRYKRFVRVLKNCENRLAASGNPALPSYLMECLVWNATDVALCAGGGLDDGFRATLLSLWGGLEGNVSDDWEEPNGIKYLFRPSQKWTKAQALQLVSATWEMLYK